MARKKIAKRSAKRPASQSSSLQKMEKEFLGIPRKLAEQLNKEIKALRQKESKLKAAVAKSKTKVKSSEMKLKNASAKSKTPSSKKQLSTLKKSHAKTMQSHAALEKQLSEASNSISASSNSHAKLVALRKHLTQFDKDWNNKAKANQTTKATKTAKPQAKKKVKLAKSKVDKQQDLKQTQQPAELENQYQPQQDAYEAANELFRIDETEHTS